MFGRIARNVAMRELKKKENWVMAGKAILEELNEMLDSPEEIMELATTINDLLDLPLVEEEEEQIIFVNIVQNIAKLIRIWRKRLNEKN